MDPGPGAHRSPGEADPMNEDPPSFPSSDPDFEVVDSLLERLLELPVEARRAALQAEEDPAVRRQVGKLLELHESPPEALRALDTPVAALPPAATTTLPERIGEYLVDSVLGAGGMGIVYRARQENPPRPVAVKVVRRATVGSEVALRFDREARFLGRLQHPGIAQIYEAGIASIQGEQLGFIAMELVEGSSITEYANLHDLGLESRVELLVQLTAAVHHAHLRGVLHRDLKPNNVLVTHEGAVKVIDFGVARALGEDGETYQATVAGQIIGTLCYMSPEQLSGRPDDVDARADVYALGVIAYELLAGRLPFEFKGTSLATAARQVEEFEPKRLGALAPACSGDLEWIVATALDKEPARRYQSANALLSDLRRYRAGDPVEARPISGLGQLIRLARKHRIVASALAFAFVSLLVGAGVATHFAIENAALARRESTARRVAEDRAAEIVRRTDPDRLTRAIRDADELYPILPATVPAIDNWLRTSGEPLAASAVQHRETLAQWRKQALPYTAEDEARDREEHPNHELLADLRAQLASVLEERDGEVVGLPRVDDRVMASALLNIANLEQRIESLEAGLEERWTYRFEDPELQEAHDNLSQLVGDLEVFLDERSGTLAKVRERRERALLIELETLTAPDVAERWTAARAAIAAHAKYGGLDLAPQIGLIPLGPDPDSGLWEFLHAASGDAPLRASDGASHWQLQEGTGLVLVLVPGGKYSIGAQPDDPTAPHYDPEARPDERPVREVEVAPYFISKYELTIAQWKRMTGRDARGVRATFTWFGNPPAETPYHVNQSWNPIESISWLDATRALGTVDLRLPTIVEWEVAARGGTSTPWWSGAEARSIGGPEGGLPAGNLADDRSRERGGPPHFGYQPWGDEWVVHAPAGNFPANAFGLHDTIGNVMEFCADRGLPQTSSNVVPARGGAFALGASEARVTRMAYAYDDDVSDQIGVRPARAVR